MQIFCGTKDARLKTAKRRNIVQILSGKDGLKKKKKKKKTNTKRFSVAGVLIAMADVCFVN